MSIDTARTRNLLPSPVAEFLRTEASGGVFLLAGALTALVWANSPWSDSYFDLWHHEIEVVVGSLDFSQSLQHWVNSGLMTIFFFVAGLEIKRELVTGELRDPRAAALPAIAAAGGMIVPALIYLSLNAGTPEVRGWGIPVATDIAFAVGVLTLLGPRVPRSLKLFVLTLAIADDIGGIVVIAVFYSDDLSVGWLVLAACTVLAMTGMRALGAVRPGVYLVPALALWVCLFQAGIEAAIAGVVLGLLTPARPLGGREVLRDLETGLAGWSSYIVVPVFALANAGVVLTGGAVGSALTSRVTLGVILGLVVGKTVGVALATYAAVRLGIGRLATQPTRTQMIGTAAVAGVGFTVALFVAEISLAGAALDEAKIGILIASCTAALLGSTLLLLAHRRSRSVGTDTFLDARAAAAEAAVP
jgi:NhaA family Na+:H+ antiporter